MKITKQQLKQIIKEELNEIGSYGLGSEPFGAEKYRNKIKGFEKMLDDMPFGDPREAKLENAITLSVSEILDNIEDEEVRIGVEDIVAELLGTKYLPKENAEVEVQGKEWVDVYVTAIKNHLEEQNTERRGWVMRMINALALAAKGE